MRIPRRVGAVLGACTLAAGSAVVLDAAAIGAAAAPVGVAAGAQGAWRTDATGAVTAHDGAPSYGTLAGRRLQRPIVGLAATPSGRGYWLVASDGGVFSFGDAAFHGSTGSIRLNQPIVGLAPTPSGRGYWLVASDGGVFSFGDARFHGSTGSIRLNQPIVALAATPSGRGYWMAARDGGVFAFGDARFAGSAAATRRRYVGMGASSTGGGYWLAAADGTVADLGDAAPVRAVGAPLAAATARNGVLTVATTDGRVLRLTGATTTTTSPPTTAPGGETRSAGLWPFSSTSPWNTPLGSGATFEAEGSLATRSLRSTSQDAWVNAGEYSQPVVLAGQGDPAARFRQKGKADVVVQAPPSATPARGTDAHLNVVDPSGRWAEESFGTGGSYPDFTSRYLVRQDLWGPGVGAGGTRAYGGSALGGLLRSWEVHAGVARHALAVGLAGDQLAPGFVWPATAEDSDAASSYRGNVHMGSLLAIPADVDVARLGLSPEGTLLARALQDYGAYVVDRAGCVCFYAEPGLDGSPALKAMRRDAARLRSLLRVVADNTPSTVGGGGVPRASQAPPIDERGGR
ncbi:MAG: hypothetical protein JWN67_1847 [Actinomycetia bacterium]|nr:hypothetical protein [Actinomycetes bacterium]